MAVRTALLAFIVLVAGFPSIPAPPTYDVIPETELENVFGDVCGFRMGSEIQDGQFTASSHIEGREPYKARFNQGLPGWRAQFNNSDQWIQIRLPAKLFVTGILTQGGPNTDYYVTEYKVEHSHDANHWSCVLDMHSQPKVFKGNDDPSTPVINKFRPALETNFVRIQPIKWHKAISMRVEVFSGGCTECWEK